MTAWISVTHTIVFALAVGLVVIGGLHVIRAIRQSQRERAPGKHSKFHHGIPRLVH